MERLRRPTREILKPQTDSRTHVLRLTCQHCSGRVASGRGSERAFVVVELEREQPREPVRQLRLAELTQELDGDLSALCRRSQHQLRRCARPIDEPCRKLVDGGRNGNLPVASHVGEEPVDPARRERLRERSETKREAGEATVAREQQELRALLLRPGQADDAGILVALAVDPEELVDRELANLRDER